jgi:hypothetical protein
MMGRLSAAGGEAKAGRFLETRATEPDLTRSLTLYVARRAFALSSFIRLGLDVASCPESVCPKASSPQASTRRPTGRRFLPFWLVAESQFHRASAALTHTDVARLHGVVRSSLSSRPLIGEEGTAEHGLPLLEGDVEHRNRIVLGPKVSVPCVLHELVAKARGYPKTWAVQTSRNRLMWREAFAATEECRAPNFEQFREAERE